MFWALVMTITVGGVSTEYVIDRAATASQCATMLRRTQDKPLYEIPRSMAASIGTNIKAQEPIAMVAFTCERTRIARR